MVSLRVTDEDDRGCHGEKFLGFVCFLRILELEPWAWNRKSYQGRAGSLLDSFGFQVHTDQTNPFTAFSKMPSGRTLNKTHNKYFQLHHSMKGISLVCAFSTSRCHNVNKPLGTVLSCSDSSHRGVAISHSPLAVFHGSKTPKVMHDMHCYP